MIGLSHIYDYFKKYEVEINAHEQKLTEKAEVVSDQVRLIQKELSRLNVEPFCHGWVEDDEEYSFNLSLVWKNSKVLFCFEDNKPEVVLGSSRETRINVGKNLENFLETGLNLIKEKSKYFN